MTKDAATRSDETPGLIKRSLPILVWLPQYQRSWLKSDVVAGLSVWALMVPTSLGYATLSGVPVQNGLYAAAAGLIVFAIFTTSRQVTQGPSSSTAPVLGAAVVSLATAGSEDAVAVAAAVVLTAGLLFVVMAVLKMGWISQFLSAAVLTGFTFGVAINVASGELFKITGTDSAGSNTWQKVGNWVSSLPEANGTTLVVGMAALVLLFGLKLLAPKVPAALVAVILGILATRVLDLGDRDVELIAEVPRGLPSPVIPDFGLILDNLATIVSAAVGLLLIGFSVTTAAVRQYATKHNYRVDINQELLAQGMSNVSSSMFQGIFNNGSLSKSPVNDDAGAKSQVSNLAQSVFIILTLLFLAPLFSDLPEAVLGAIIIEAVVMGMMDVGEMRRLLSVKPFEFAAALAALLGVMTFGILPGVFIGVGLSMIWLVAVSALPYIPDLGRKPGTDAFFDVDRHEDCETYPGLTILRFDGGLFFVNADALSDRVRQIRIESTASMQGVVLSMEGVNFIDTEGADVLKAIARAGTDRSIDLYLARVKPQVVEVLERDGFFDLVSRDHVSDDIAAAVRLHAQRHPAAARE
ncbi:MAG: SulP family inorganic anion transporter [Jiangellales bacterium]